MGKLYAERNAVDGLDPYFSCMPGGPLRITGGFAWRLIQHPTTNTTHLHAAGRQRAHIQANLPGWPQAPEDPSPTWYGHSIGRWEGDTLVVDTIGLNDRFWLDPAARPIPKASSGGAIRALLHDVASRSHRRRPGAFTRPFTVTYRKAWNARKRDPRIHLYREQPVWSRSGACSSEYQEVRQAAVRRLRRSFMKGSCGIVSTVVCPISVFVAASTAWAQATAQLSGRVTDDSGGVLPGVTVTVTQTDTGFTRTTVTDDGGGYVLPNLPLGPCGSK